MNKILFTPILPKLLTLPIIPYLRYLRYFPLPFLVAPTHHNILYLTPSYSFLSYHPQYLPHSILSIAPMAIYFIFIPYFILPYPTLLKLGRNGPGTKRLRAETTHQIKPYPIAPKIMPNDQDGNDQGPKRPVRILWHDPIFCFKYEKICQMKKQNCRHIHLIF